MNTVNGVNMIAAPSIPLGLKIATFYFFYYYFLKLQRKLNGIALLQNLPNPRNKGMLQRGFSLGEC